MASIQVVPFTANTSTGNQDITGTSIGTPDAVMFIMSDVTAYGTSVNAHASLCVGFTDGTNNSLARATSKDAVAASATYRNTSSAYCAGTYSFNVGNADASFVTWITDGVRINWAIAPSAAVKGVAVFFYDSITADSGVATNTSGNVSTSAEPELILASNVAYATSSVDSSFSIGAFGNRTTNEQATLATFQGHNYATALNVSVMRNDAIDSECARSTFDEVGRLAISATTGGGTPSFTRSLTGAGNGNFAYLSLNLGGKDVRVTIEDTPTSTGTQTVTTGFYPQFVMFIGSWLTAVNSTATDTTAFTQAIGVHDGTTGFCVSQLAQDNVGTMYCKSLVNNNLITARSPDGSTLLNGDLSSFNATGYDISWSNVDSSARKFISIAVEGDAPAISLYHPRRRII